MSKTFLIAGGDLRQVYVAKSLAEKDFTVYAAGFDENIAFPEGVTVIDNITLFSGRVDYLVLPLPVSNDGVTLNAPFCKSSIPINLLTTVVNDGGLVFGGRFSPVVKNMFTDCKIETADYLEREELNVLNAVPTAEGAVQIAMEELPRTISGLDVLVLGAGRIGKVLVKILHGLGAGITVAARKYSDLAWAEIAGCKTVHIAKLPFSPLDYDLMFNTVPAAVLDEEALGRLGKDALVIDLASKPGGVDFDAARRLGIKVVWALSLPGKVAPVTSGEIIAHTVLNILCEQKFSERGQYNCE